jgi:NitT/TauT family transport system substrate-binding protein
MLAALEAGQVDAVSVTEPFYTIGSAGGAREILTVINLGGERPGFVTDTYFTTEEYLEQNPEVVAAFRRAIYRANQMANENPDLVRQVVATYTPIPEEILAQMRLPFWPVEPISRDDVELMISLMQDYGILTGTAPTYEELVRE